MHESKKFKIYFIPISYQNITNWWHIIWKNNHIKHQLIINWWHIVYQLLTNSSYWPIIVTYCVYNMQLASDISTTIVYTTTIKTSDLSTKVIDSVLYWPVQSEYTVLASNPICSTPLFCTGKNTGRTGIVPTKSGCTGR